MRSNRDPDIQCALASIHRHQSRIDALTYELASEGIPLNDTDEWRNQLNKICAVNYSAEILARVASRWLDRHMVDCTPD